MTEAWENVSHGFETSYPDLCGFPRGSTSAMIVEL